MNTYTDNNINNNTTKKVHKKQMNNQSINNIINSVNNNTNNANNNNNNNGTKKASTFQDAIVAKSDVGEFAGGYFIMPSSEQDNLKLKKPNIHYQKNSSPQRKKLPPTVNQFEQQKLESSNNVNNTNNNNNNIHKTPSKNNNKEQFKSTEQPIEILLTPSFLVKENSFTQQQENTSTPQKGKQNHNKILSPQSSMKQMNTTPLRSNSPSKKSLSPTSSAPCWAGGAFNNSPSPNSLPMPNFDDDTPSQITQVDLQSMTFDLRRLLNITPSISVSES